MSKVRSEKTLLFQLHGRCPGRPHLSETTLLEKSQPHWAAHSAIPPEEWEKGMVGWPTHLSLRDRHPWPTDWETDKANPSQKRKDPENGGIKKIKNKKYKTSVSFSATAHRELCSLGTDKWQGPDLSDDGMKWNHTHYIPSTEPALSGCQITSRSLWQ